jgi:hypothetical protein
MSIYNLREDFDEAAKHQGHLMSPRALEDAWDDFTTYNGTMIDFHKDRKVRCPHRYAVPVADTTKEPALYSVEEQRKYAQAHGVEALTALLSANGLKGPGFVKPSLVRADEMTGANNPYDDRYLKTHTPAQREAKIHSLVTTSPTLANQLSAAAGKNVMGEKLIPAAERMAAERKAREDLATAARQGEKR